MLDICGIDSPAKGRGCKTASSIDMPLPQIEETRTDQTTPAVKIPSVNNRT